MNELYPSTKSKLKGSLYLTIAASIWGGMFVVVKIVVPSVPPLILVWSRYLVGIIALLLFCLQQRIHWQIKVRDWPLLISIGLIGQLASIVFQETGTMLANAQIGSIITSTTPAFMTLFAALILNEKLTKLRILAVVSATIGVMFAGGGLFHVKQSQLLGVASLVIAALTWALMSVLLKKVPVRYSALQITTVATIVAIIGLTPMVFSIYPHYDWPILLTAKVSSGILYLGIVSTAISFVLWNKGLRYLKASQSGLFFFFQPIVGSLLGWLVLGEALHLSFLAGCLLIFFGVVLTLRE
ncbi:DMT family transporter [Secundilactobacillus folii]|uniref:EamA family transporter n=1 Tax=Secundilactobacillus folii TaxID=2678357 RepID=A0A7X3C1C6_9LACO|nr:DMT family transporter [Secundilactobacillus folii]MTV81585.1 EamA family transporter [Secundilactobacillus folii]